MITREEYLELKNRYNEGYRWIARDENGYAYTYYREPKKLLSSWNDIQLGCFAWRISKYTFLCIKWEDEKPTKILDLIQDYETHQTITNKGEKMQIPQFVADWIEHVNDMERPIKLELLFGTLSMPTEVREWLIKDDKHTDILARAWLDGYTITSKRYEFPLPHLETALGGQQYLTHDAIYFAYGKCDYYKQVWSEDELKNIPSEYLKYKVEVD